MKKLVMALVPLLVVGCGEDLQDANGDGIADGVQNPNNVSVVVPATPKGTVSGQVLTTQQQPLAGVNVSMTIGSALATKTTQTDAEGNFAFTDVPGGAQLLLTFGRDGYAPLRAYSRVPTEAGNVPINNGNASFGPVLLSETNGTVRFTLIAPTGRPAEGVRATLEVDGAGTVLFGPTDSISSTVVGEAVADAQGVVTFNNVPPPAEIDRITTGSAYKLVVHAHDTNGDGILDYNGLTRTYSGAALLTGSNAQPLELPFTYDPRTTNLAVSYSNLAAIKGGSILPQYNMLRSGENIYITFNQPVQTNSVIVGLTDEYGKENLNITKSVASGGLVLTLSPQGLQPGKEYNLYVRAVSLNGGTAFNKTVAFFGGDLTSPQTISIESIQFQDSGTSNNQLDPGEKVYINFNQVMRKFGAESVYVLFDANINSAGGIGDIPGEVGNPSGTGFVLAEAEPLAPIQTKTPAELPVFTINTSGFTTRYAFTYQGTGLVPLNPAAFGSLQVVVAFSGLRDPSVSGMENAWGVPQTTSLTGAIFNTSAIPPPTPAQ